MNEFQKHNANCKKPEILYDYTINFHTISKIGKTTKKK